MRGDDRRPDAMFRLRFAREANPPGHPLRAIRAMVDAVLRSFPRGSRSSTRTWASLS